MRLTIPLLIAFLLAAFIACGPASGTGEKEGDPTPTATPKGDEPTKQPDPTATTKPTETPAPDEEPASSPEPSPTDTPVSTPSPTPIPTPDHGPIDDPMVTTPHPGGIEACKAMNMWVSDATEVITYLLWCKDTLERDVRTHCRTASGTEAQLACARDRLATVENLDMRIIAACSAVTDPEAVGDCAVDAFGRLDHAFYLMWDVWPVILNTVDSNADVKERKVAVSDCMAEQGYTRPDPDNPIRWHTFNKPSTEPPGKPNRGATHLERMAAWEAKDKALEQCAVDNGLYEGPGYPVEGRDSTYRAERPGDSPRVQGYWSDRGPRTRGGSSFPETTALEVSRA